MDTIFEYTRNEIEEMLSSGGYKKFSATQLFGWIYKKKTFDFSLMTNLSTGLREFLNSAFSMEFPLVDKKEISKDSTVKYLYSLKDNSKVEAVLMHHSYGNSICVSSQVGCNMGCAFCASGLKKKTRNLRAAEMVSMILQTEKEENEKITHVVIMGTGEPLDNLDEVLKFINIINDPYGLEIGIRHITLSTSGIVPAIYKLAEKNIPINLAISLHAPTDELRSRIMPINKAYPLKDLIKAASDYFDATGRRITFEYLLLKGINDSLLMADKLADNIRGLNAYVNLIPYNPVKEFKFEASDGKSVMAFYSRLKERGINVTLRKRMGDDISAACGQLRSTVKS